MSTMQNPAQRNAIGSHEQVRQKSKIARYIIDADCSHEENTFVLFSLPRKLPGLFTVRFTAPADFTPGDTINVKGQELAVRNRTMEEPEGSVFSAGAVVQCDIDMERELAFLTTGNESQTGTPALPVVTIYTSAPLIGGGELSSDRTLAITPATAATATTAGVAGSVVYAADSDTTSRDKAATPAKVAGDIAKVVAAKLGNAELVAVCQINGDGTLAAAGGSRQLSAIKNSIGSYTLHISGVVGKRLVGSVLANVPNRTVEYDSDASTPKTSDPGAYSMRVWDLSGNPVDTNLQVLVYAID